MLDNGPAHVPQLDDEPAREDETRVSLIEYMIYLGLSFAAQTRELARYDAGLDASDKRLRAE